MPRGGHDVMLKTDPGSPPTHWKQTAPRRWPNGMERFQVVYLGAFPQVESGDVLEAVVTMEQSENPRQYNISVETL